MDGFDPVELIALFPLILLPVIFHFVLRRSASKTFRTQAAFHTPHEYTFEEDVVRLRGENFESDYNWALVYKVTSNRKAIYLWLSQNSASIIPKRDLSALELSDLMELCAEKCRK